MDAIQEYQLAKQKHRNAEMAIARVKAQVEVYQKDIADILASESVNSVEELTEKYKIELANLESITKVLQKETEIANQALASIGE